MKTIVGITNNLTGNQLSKLDSFVMMYNHISHRLYVDLFIKKLLVKDLSPAYQAQYLISKRHFDSIRATLEGKVSSILALNKNYIQDTKDKIHTIQKELISQNKTYNHYKLKLKNDGKLSLVETNFKSKLHTKMKYNHIRLDRLKVKLTKLELIKSTGDVQLCFGSKKLFKQQFSINSKNNLTQFKSHEEWYKAWFYNRNKEFTLVGSKDETTGNHNAQITHIKDNLFNLKLNINHKANKTDKYVNVNFTVNHDVNTLINIIKNNNGKNKDLWQPLTYKLIKQPIKSHHQDKYVVAISFEKYLIKHISTSKNNGCLGIDINQDHLAISNIDSKGNLLNIETLKYDLNGTAHQNNNSISLAIKDLMLIAVTLNKPIVIEKLDFSAKKKSLIAGINKTKNKQLSSFAYSKIIELIKARAEDNYVEVREVNPAYTSMIGSIKYSKRSRISVHHGAAMCIGRKGLFNKVSIVKVINKETNKESNQIVTKYDKEKRISSKNKQIKSSDLPERNNLKLVVYWKELKENMVKSNQHGKKRRVKDAEYSTSLGNRDMPVMNASVVTLS